MAKYKAHLFLLVFLSMYLFVKLLIKNDLVDSFFFRFYFTDLLFVPSMCLFALIGVRSLKRDNKIRIPVKYVFAQTVFVSILFEYVLPSSQTYAKLQTADFWMQSFIYWCNTIFINPKKAVDFLFF